MKVIVITTLHQPGEFKNYPNVIRFTNDFTELADILLRENLLQEIKSW
jgi:hypothetical protein